MLEGAGIFVGAVAVFLATDFMMIWEGGWRWIAGGQMSETAFLAAYRRSRIARFLSAGVLSLICTWALSMQPLSDDNRWLFPIFLAVASYHACIIAICTWFAVKSVRDDAKPIDSSAD